MLLYRFILFLSGLAVDLFYRREVISGVVPSGPVVLVSNHPNGLVDPVVIARTAKRVVRLLAKEPIFRMPVLGWLARAMRCLPVYRTKDGHSTDRNADTFRAVHDALAAGDAVALFPEGVSHDEPRLLSLKTGAARMALGAEADHDWALGVRVVPIGVFYEDKPIFRSGAFVQVGEPIGVAPYRAGYEADEREATRALTEAMREALLQLTVNLEDRADLALLHMLERIWLEQAELEEPLHPFEQKRAIAEADAELRARSPARRDALRGRVAALSQQLEELKLDVDSLNAPTLGRVVPYTLRNLVALVVGLPVALIGGVAYFVPFTAVRLLPVLKDFGPDVVATARVLLALLLFPLWHAGIAALLTWWLGSSAALPIGIALPFAGLYAYRYGARRVLALRRAGFVWTRHAARLRSERDAILDEMRAVVEELDLELGPQAASAS